MNSSVAALLTKSLNSVSETNNLSIDRRLGPATLLIFVIGMKLGLT
jgi:hypothetical protein